MNLVELAQTEHLTLRDDPRLIQQAHDRARIHRFQRTVADNFGQDIVRSMQYTINEAGIVTATFEASEGQVILSQPQEGQYKGFFVWNDQPLCRANNDYDANRPLFLQRVIGQQQETTAPTATPTPPPAFTPQTTPIAEE